MQKIILQIEETNEERLLAKIDELIKNRLAALSKPIEEEEFMTREQVAKLLQVSEVTIWQWSKPDKGILKPYRIGCKVRFKRSEVLNSPKMIK